MEYDPTHPNLPVSLIMCTSKFHFEFLFLSGLLSADNEEETDSKDGEIYPEKEANASDDRVTQQQSLQLEPPEFTPDHHTRARLVRQKVVDHERGFSQSFSQQSRGRASFASSDFSSMSLIRYESHTMDESHTVDELSELSG